MMRAMRNEATPFYTEHGKKDKEHHQAKDISEVLQQ